MNRHHTLDHLRTVRELYNTHGYPITPAQARVDLIYCGGLGWMARAFFLGESVGYEVEPIQTARGQVRYWRYADTAIHALLDCGVSAHDLDIRDVTVGPRPRVFYFGAGPGNRWLEVEARRYLLQPELDFEESDVVGR